MDRHHVPQFGHGRQQFFAVQPFFPVSGNHFIRVPALKDPALHGPVFINGAGVAVRPVKKAGRAAIHASNLYNIFRRGVQAAGNIIKNRLSRADGINIGQRDPAAFQNRPVARMKGGPSFPAAGAAPGAGRSCFRFLIQWHL